MGIFNSTNLVNGFFSHNTEILFFILVFLILFSGEFGYYDNREEVVE